MDIHRNFGTRLVWIWGDIHVHRYLYGQTTMRLMDLDRVYPSKLASLPSLEHLESCPQNGVRRTGRIGGIDTN
jgi:hypothetical protein